MKKKIRQIVVSDKVYRWSISKIDANFVCLKVWQTESKSVPWIVVRYRFDDPWLHFHELTNVNSKETERNFQLNPIQPNYVAQIITDANDIDLTRVGQNRKTLHFEYDVKGQLTPIDAH